MTVSDNKGTPVLHPYIAAKVNHNVLNESKVMNIIHTIIGNPYHGGEKKDLQPEEMGSDTCVLIGIKQTTVSLCYPFVFYCLSSKSLINSYYKIRISAAMTMVTIQFV
jgi:hypothetical protein